MILLASFGYAVATLLVNHYLADLAPVAVTAAVLGLSTALLAVPAMLTWSPVWPRPTVLAALGCLGIACTGLAFLAYYALVATAGAARAAVSTYLAPGFSVLAGISLLGEEFTARSAAGLSLILLSSWLATRTRPARSPGCTPPSGNRVDVADPSLRKGCRAHRSGHPELRTFPFLMATGGTGYHVVAPLDRATGFDEVRDLVRDLSDVLAGRSRTR